MATTSTAVLREEFGNKVRRRVFEPVRRLLRVEPDDRMQEGLGMTWEGYQAKAEKTGEVMDDALLVHVCKLKACDFNRHLVRRSHTLRDASDPRNYHLGRVELLHLDGHGVGTPLELEVRYPAANPEEKIHSAIDLTGWLQSLDARDVELLALRQAGCTLQEVSRATGRSLTGAHHRLRALGYELAGRAQVVVEEKPRKRRAGGGSGP